MKPHELIAAVVYMVFVCIVTVCIYELGTLKGIEMGKATKIVPPSIEEIDRQCMTWLFKSELQESKRRICGGKK